jgi:amino acid adenylation domain-containing protein
MLDEMFSAYVSCLNKLAENENAWKENIGSFIPPSTLQKRKEFNSTEVSLPAELLHQPFLRQAQKNPGLTALLTADKEITYGELLKASSKVSQFLRKQDIRPNELVALMMPKGWEQIVAVLGILQSGGAYLNIDPDLPEERRKYLIENAGVRVVMIQVDAPDLAIPEDRIVYRIDDSLFDGAEIEPLAATQTVTDLAYVIYTSGSTGMPKGVMISHEGAYNTIADIIAKFNVTQSDRIFCISSLSFDLSVFDIFGTLAVGAAIVLPNPNSERDADQTIGLLEKYNVTIWNSVPALLELLVENLEQRGKSLPLQLVMLSGDWIPITLPDRIRKVAPGAKVVSLGGATEASIWSIYYPIKHVNPTWASIPYGMPLANQKIYVLNERYEHCPDWVIGDLYIGGIGLAKGYLADKEKTDRAFVIHPVTGERMYRTADLGRFLPDGFVEFLGREDFQIKIGGYRVELGEIESTLSHHDKIRRAAVKKIVGKDGNEVLTAYFSLNGKGRLELETSGKSGDYGMELKGNGDLLLDPVERLKFKLSQAGLRERSDALVPLPAKETDIPPLYIKRGSSRRFLDQKLPLERFGNLLSCLKQVQFDGLPKYRYGSAGGLYPVQVYVAVQAGKVEGIKAGVYYYDPRDHALMTLGTDSIIDPSVHVAANRSIHEASAFSVFLVGKLDAITPLYGTRSRDFCLIEAGLITQLLETAGVKNEIGFCQIGGFQKDSFAQEVFQLGESSILLHALIGGCVDYADPARSMPVGPEGRKSNPQKLTAEIRSYCVERLPKYMIPSQWVIMEEMPLSSVGKINYKALPDPFENAETVRQDHIKPRNELEKIIADILQEKLGIKTVDIHDNFFDMGADSMMITRAYRVVVQKTGIDFPVIRMFEYASVAALSSYLSEMKDDKPEYSEIEENAARKKEAIERRMAIKRR